MGADESANTRAGSSHVPFPPTVSADAPARQPRRASVMAPPFVAGPGQEPSDAVWLQAEAEPPTLEPLEPAEAAPSAPWTIRVDAGTDSPSSDDPLSVGHFVDAGQAQPVFSHPDDEPDTAGDAHRLADRLEAVGRRVRLEGDAALRDLMAHGEPFDVAIAAILTAYLAHRP